ncbi:MAG: UDP-N-acetylmuramate--L-alanine ligase [Candidatus Paceibacterota bacterium]
MKQKRYYFIGIGGIGMSALARMLTHEGHAVTGSDRDATELTKTLEAEGISVTYTQVPENITGEIDAVVYTVAIPDDHPELVAAREKGIPTRSYPEMLGEISKDKYTIAVAGTHGKTTTTAMLAAILQAAKLDPTVIVGSLLVGGGDNGWGSNFVAGKSDYLVVEACEYKRSFLHLHPDVLVITNIEEDHLDYYKNLADIQSAFDKLAEKVPAEPATLGGASGHEEGGAIVCNPNSTGVMPVVGRYQTRVIDYTQLPADGIELSVPGKHNKENAQAALAVAAFLRISEKTARQALAGFKGTWRRFELKGTHSSGALLYDDYAHHPSEIRATLAAFREKYPDKRLRVVFQPHLYSRTEQLLESFAGSFEIADEVLLAPVYAAREQPAAGVDHRRLADAIAEQNDQKKVQALDSFGEVIGLIEGSLDANDVVVTLGAGDIHTIHSHFV